MWMPQHFKNTSECTAQHTLHDSRLIVLPVLGWQCRRSWAWAFRWTEDLVAEQRSRINSNWNQYIIKVYLRNCSVLLHRALCRIDTLAQYCNHSVFVVIEWQEKQSVILQVLVIWNKQTKKGSTNCNSWWNLFGFKKRKYPGKNVSRYRFW
jgi:hypothetical protein